MSWRSIETVRCERCAVFTPSDEVQFAVDGTTYCVTCGPPSVAMARTWTPAVPRPVAAAAAICAALFVAIVLLAELAT
jgi:hypothetical protein